MSDFYTNLKATSLALLKDKGMPMLLHKQTPGSYDPTTGAASVAEHNYEVTGVQLPFPASQIDGSMIQRGDLKVVLSADGVVDEPDVGDALTADCVRRSIVSVRPVAPAGSAVIYILQVRK